MIKLQEYLNKLNNDNMDELLSNYSVTIYDNPKDIEIGLLRFNKPLKNRAFLFIMPKEEIQHFHTVGMKFPIKIFFFNSKKEIVYSSGIVKPGIKDISSKIPCKYVVELGVN